jgi:uncharacterized protein
MQHRPDEDLDLRLARKIMKLLQEQLELMEYTPLFLISFVLLESVQASSDYLILAGFFFLLGRIFHAYSMFSKKELFRALGMILTFGPYLANIINLLIVYFK